jgi:hypothetical protein
MKNILLVYKSSITTKTYTFSQDESLAMNPSKQFESNPFIDANSFLREFQEH